MGAGACVGSQLVCLLPFLVKVVLERDDFSLIDQTRRKSRSCRQRDYFFLGFTIAPHQRPNPLRLIEVLDIGPDAQNSRLSGPPHVQFVVFRQGEGIIQTACDINNLGVQDFRHSEWLQMQRRTPPKEFPARRDAGTVVRSGGYFRDLAVGKHTHCHRP